MVLNADKFATWAPHFIFEIIQGAIPADELRKRTVSLTLVDNAREYDTIEWSLVNNDGLLTRVENMALGLIVRVRLGYMDYTMNWRTFVISRMRGGVGVYGRAAPAVAEGNSIITLSGRNRNAPDLKGRRKKGTQRVPKPGMSGRTTYRRSRGGASASVAQYDTVKKDGWTSPTELERVIRATRVSDAIREIGLRMGYTYRQMFVEDTDDFVSQVVIPQGSTYSEFILKEAARRGWTGKCDKTLEFHPQRWSKDTQPVKIVLTYGGPDIIDLSLDADFRLPVPSEMKTKGHNPILRRNLIASSSPHNSAVAEYPWIDDRPLRNQVAEHTKTRIINLKRKEVSYVTGGTQRMVGPKAERMFINKHMRAMAIRANIVGNPQVEARDRIIITGTGCQLVDGEWYIDRAQHNYDGTTYVTQLSLRPPTRKKQKGQSLYWGADVKNKNKTGIGAKVGQILSSGSDFEMGKASGLRTPGRR